MTNANPRPDRTGPGRTIRLLLVALCLAYTLFAGFMIRSLHTPVQVTFADLTESVATESSTGTLASHPYLKWTAGRADRRRSGVVLHNRQAARRGYNLFTDDRQHALLMDMDGALVHAWRARDHNWAEQVLVRPDGRAYVLGVMTGLVQLDRFSRRIWSYPGRLHHEVARDIDGGLIVLGLEDRLYRGRTVPFDYMDFLAPDGTFRRRWSTFDNLKSLQGLHGPAPVDLGRTKDPSGALLDDYYHMNAVQVLPPTPLGRRDPRFRAGNYLLCLRNVNLAVILDRKLQPVWHWGEGEIDLPHMPRMLPTGNILIFDNGQRRGWSRVVEVDPVRGKVVWQYKADPPDRFFSPLRGSCQRLPGGNTLICSSERGRAFEVTREGRIVWEFFNPIFNEQGQRRGMYRLTRLAPDEVEPFLRKGGAGLALIAEPVAWLEVVLLLLPIPLLLLVLLRSRRRGGSPIQPEPPSVAV